MFQVQPVAELSELSRRSGHDGREVVLDDANIRGGTLKRSGSRRFNGTTTVSVFFYIVVIWVRFLRIYTRKIILIFR